jgi:hypothetical protein
MSDAVMEDRFRFVVHLVIFLWQKSKAFTTQLRVDRKTEPHFGP